MVAPAGEPVTAEQLRRYRSFRTGLTYQQVREQLWQESCAARQAGRPFLTVRRSLVLGRWRELKLGMWKYQEAGRPQ